MFEALIRRELPQTVQALYTIARQQQPQDCQGPLCPHRDKLRPTDMEWQHELRRELHKMAVTDKKRNGTWRLK